MMVRSSAPFGMPDDQPRAGFIAEGKEIKLAAELAMVAALCLLDPLQIELELLLVGEGRGVDALQHGVLFVAAPVGAGHAGQLERLEQTGRRDMRTAAEIDEISLTVERHLVVGEIANQLDLVALLPSPRRELIASSLIIS